MNRVRTELRAFWAALLFFTRVPLPRWCRCGPEDLPAAARYFPFVGVFVGAFGALVWWLARHVFPSEIAVVLSMVATVLLTGAFHEDGFTDVCDGFGGGWDKAQVLAIMKDSRVGAFGVIGIVLLLGLKALALGRIPPGLMIATLIAGHAISRWASTTVIFTEVYVRDDPGAKSKPLATALSVRSLTVATLFGLAPLALLPLRLWTTLAVVLVARWWFVRSTRRRIGGYTGDVLGAMQQIAEVAFYLAVVALTWR